MTLCKLIISSIPLYCLSLFQMPLGVCKQIEKRMRTLLWNSGPTGALNHLVQWNISSKLLEDGGLGVGGLSKKNKALLAKWGWRFGCEINFFWRQVVASLSGKIEFGWSSRERINCCLRSPWINISRH